jgi:hypothetical protein
MTTDALILSLTTSLLPVKVLRPARNIYLCVLIIGLVVPLILAFEGWGPVSFQLFPTLLFEWNIRIICGFILVATLLLHTWILVVPREVTLATRFSHLIMVTASTLYPVVCFNTNLPANFDSHRTMCFVEGPVITLFSLSVFFYQLQTARPFNRLHLTVTLISCAALIALVMMDLTCLQSSIHSFMFHFLPCLATTLIAARLIYNHIKVL